MPVMLQPQGTLWHQRLAQMCSHVHAANLTNPSFSPDTQIYEGRHHERSRGRVAARCARAPAEAAPVPRNARNGRGDRRCGLHRSGFGRRRCRRRRSPDLCTVRGSRGRRRRTRRRCAAACACPAHRLRLGRRRPREDLWGARGRESERGGPKHSSMHRARVLGSKL